MFKKCMITIIALFPALFFAAAASAAENAASPRSFVQRLAHSTLGIIQRQDVAGADEAFAQSFDMQSFARRCLVDHWAPLTDAQRAEFTAVFSRLLRMKLNEGLSKKTGGRGLSYSVGNAESNSSVGAMEVPVSVLIDGRSVVLKYYVEKSSKGFALVDYDVGGALLSRNYRGQFNYLMRNYGYDGMIGRMIQKTDALRSRSLALRD